jgi:primosomal protein N' (replication factor Y)
MQALLDIAERGEPCVFIGTQMLTKGHHFPAVQLVGIIDADALLFSADFRGEERMAQLITQVAGRAGREDSGGRVLLQTHYPDSGLFRELRTGSYGAAARRMLGERRAAGLPPAAQLVMLRADAPVEKDAEAFLAQLRRQLPPLPTGCAIIGPLPSSLPRRAGRFRWQLWCISRDRRATQRTLRALVATGESLRRPRQLNWFVDVDPVDVV